MQIQRSQAVTGWNASIQAAELESDFLQRLRCLFSSLEEQCKHNFAENCKILELLQVFCHGNVISELVDLFLFEVAECLGEVPLQEFFIGSKIIQAQVACLDRIQLWICSGNKKAFIAAECSLVIAFSRFGPQREEKFFRRSRFFPPATRDFSNPDNMQIVQMLVYISIGGLFLCSRLRPSQKTVVPWRWRNVPKWSHNKQI